MSRAPLLAPTTLSNDVAGGLGPFPPPLMGRSPSAERLASRCIDRALVRRADGVTRLHERRSRLVVVHGQPERVELQGLEELVSQQGRASQRLAQGQVPDLPGVVARQTGDGLVRARDLGGDEVGPAEGAEAARNSASGLLQASSSEKETT